MARCYSSPEQTGGIRLPHNFQGRDRSRLLNSSGTASIAGSRSRIEKSVDFKLVDHTVKTEVEKSTLSNPSDLAELKSRFESPQRAAPIAQDSEKKSASPQDAPVTEVNKDADLEVDGVG